MIPGLPLFRANAALQLPAFSVLSLFGLGLATGELLGADANFNPGLCHRPEYPVSRTARASVAGIAARIFTGWLKQRTRSY